MRPVRKDERAKLIGARNKALELSSACLDAVEEYARLGAMYGVPDVFSDSGGRTLQVLLHLGLIGYPNKRGHDAYDADGEPYEIKTIRLDSDQKIGKRELRFNARLSGDLVDVWGGCEWVFATFDGLRLVNCWCVDGRAFQRYMIEQFPELGDPSNAVRKNYKIKLSWVQDWARACRCPQSTE